jgi:hypothetical protein
MSESLAGARPRRVVAPIAIRAVVLLAGIALVVLPGSLHPVPVLITLVGLAGALFDPRTIGVSVLSIGFVIGWVAADGWTHALPIARTVPAAAALYVAHVSTALAAAAPLRAGVDPAALRHWLHGCVWPVLAGAAIVAADEALPERTGTAWVEVAGLAALTVFAGAAVHAVRRHRAD